MDYDTFTNEVSKLGNKRTKGDQTIGGEGEDDMNKMMMSSKKRKLYEKMKHSQKRKDSEVRFIDLTSVTSGANKVLIFVLAP